MLNIVSSRSIKERTRRFRNTQNTILNLPINGGLIEHRLCAKANNSCITDFGAPMKTHEALLKVDFFS